MIKQSFTIIDFITSKNSIHFNSYAKMFTVNDSIFQTPGHSSVTQNLTIIKKSQLVTITSAMLNERKQSLCDSLLNYSCSI